MNIQTDSFVTGDIRASALTTFTGEKKVMLALGLAVTVFLTVAEASTLTSALLAAMTEAKVTG